MLEYIIPIISTFLVLILGIILYVFYFKKKQDENDGCEIKAHNPGNKLVNTANKKAKKKTSKKGNTIEQEQGNNTDDAVMDVERNENSVISEVKNIHVAVEENITPLKSGDETATPEKRKRRSKVKPVSGDQVSSETRAIDENQSNTLLGRNHDEKLQEEINSLLKKLDDLDNERKNNETAINEIKSSMVVKERENESLKNNLIDITGQMTKLKSEFELEKAKANKLLTEKENTKKDFEKTKAQMNHDNQCHTEMYQKYETRIEELNGEIKKLHHDVSALNSRLKDTLDNAAKCDKKFNDVNRTLSEKLEELKQKEHCINQFQEMNNQLKKAVADLQNGLSAKEFECVNIRNVMNDQNIKLQEMINKLEHDKEGNISEIATGKQNEKSLKDKISNLASVIDELSGKIAQSDQIYKNKYSEMDDNNTRLQVAIHTLEKEMDSNRRIISELEENNAMYRNNSDSIDKISSMFAAKEEEFKKQSSEMINELQKTIDSKNQEITICHMDEMTLDNRVKELMAEKALKEEESNIKHDEMKKQITILHDTIKSLEKNINDKDLEIKNILEKEKTQREQVVSLNQKVENLKIGTVEQDDMIKKYHAISDEKSKLEAIVTELKITLDDKTLEIENLMKANNSLSEQFSSVQLELKERMIVKEEESLRQNAEIDLSKDLSDKVKSLSDELHKKDTQVKNLIEEVSSLSDEKLELEKEYTEKTKELNHEIVSLTKEISLLQEQSSEQMDKKEESLLQNAEIYMSKDLLDKVEFLSEELHNKDKQMKNLLEEISSLSDDKLELEKEYTEKTKELNHEIVSLTKEISLLQEQTSEQIVKEEMIAESSVPLSSECNSYVPAVDSDEVEKLKSHITKLEKELKSMQGRYYVLKADSIKIDDKDRHENRSTVSETNVISIHPTDSHNCALVQTNDEASETRSITHDSLKEAINRLNSEIEEQRLTNQKLSGHLTTKESEVKYLKQCLLGLDGSLSNIGTMANELQKSCSVTQIEKNTVKCQHDTLLKDHGLLKQRYVELEKRLSSLNETIGVKSNDIDTELTKKMALLQEENCNLRGQLEQYRTSLEVTEQMLEKIQLSVDKEQGDWAAALRSSEQDCSRLEMKVRELTSEIEELKSENVTEGSNMVHQNQMVSE